MMGSPLVFLLSVIILLWLNWSCSRKDEVEISLEGIESVIMSRPDSAMTLLDAIDTLQLVKDRQKAMYGMLFTMASDKVYRDPKNEELIDYAAEYFKKKGDVRREMISRYYKGRVLYHKEKFPEALISFYAAKELGEKQEDYFYMGMSCRGISDTYLQTSSSADELIYAKKEFEYLQKSGMQPYINYALLDLASSYNNNDSNNKVLLLTQQIIDSSCYYNDKYLLNRAYSLRNHNLMWLGQYDEALFFSQSLINSGYSTLEDTLYYCWNLVELGKIEEAKELMNILTDSTNPLYDYVFYKINKNLNNNDIAIIKLENLSIKLNNKITSKRSIKLSSNLAEFFELDKKIKEAEIEIKDLRENLIIFISITVLGILIFFLNFLKIRYKRKDIIKRSAINELEINLRNNIEKISKSNRVINELIKSQYKLVSEIGELYRFHSDSESKIKKKIEEKINTILKEFSYEDGNLNVLEKEIDDIHDNLFSDFRIDLPNLKDIDYALYLYCIFGFSNASITIFLKETNIGSIYNRKRRLKDKINSLSSEKQKRYLSVI